MIHPSSHADPLSPLVDTAADEEIVTVAGLAKSFGDRRVLEGVSFSVRKGECVGFLGPNGAGKTTCINILLGLVRRDAGGARLLGLEVPEAQRAVKARIGVVPQADSLDPDLTVEENLLVHASYYSIPSRLARERVAGLLEFFALHNRRGEIIEHLSGGQRRRLLLARALINDPALLILDEPTVGLDPQARHLMWERLEALREKGTTMLLTSHYLDEVARLSDRVIILDHGRIVAQGEPRQLVTEMVGLEVYEVEGTVRELDMLQEQFLQCRADFERVGERLLVYAREDCSRLESVLASAGGWLKRPANLEDLFIQLTGRSLRD
ncbi:MAG: ATP-binding cassette domain-containing protein [Thermodesulfobacteriota bacterium]